MLSDTNLIRIPALIDPHVHFRTPGAEHKENWITAARAAVAGGVTTVIDMPNNIPSCTTLDHLQKKHALIQSQLQEADIPLRYHLYFGADRRHLKEIPKAKALCAGIKVFMGSSTGDLLIDDDASLNEIFRMAADLDMLVSVHAEDEEIIKANKERMGETQDVASHSIIRSRDAAIKAVDRALNLSAKYGTRLCILHMSTKEELVLLKNAKKAGINAFGETSPHHLLLNRGDYPKWGTLAKVNPPLRDVEDNEALWAAINDGTVDFIGTDHAPHTFEEKALPSDKAPSGIPSVELLLPLLLDAVNRGKISLDTLVKITRTNIEKIFRLTPNDDVVLVDMNKTKTINNGQLKTKCGWSPYTGRTLQGWPTATFLHGREYKCY